MRVGALLMSDLPVLNLDTLLQQSLGQIKYQVAVRLILMLKMESGMRQVID